MPATSSAKRSLRHCPRNSWCLKENPVQARFWILDCEFWIQKRKQSERENFRVSPKTIFRGFRFGISYKKEK